MRDTTCDRWINAHHLWSSFRAYSQNLAFQAQTFTDFPEGSKNQFIALGLVVPPEYVFHCIIFKFRFDKAAWNSFGHNFEASIGHYCGVR